VSQARRTNRKASPQQKVFRDTFKEFAFFGLSFLSLYLFASLLTYYPLDPSLSYSGGQIGEIRNYGGTVGAWLADILLNLFGYLAYVFAAIVPYVGWLISQNRHHDIFREPRDLIIPGIGFILIISAGCGLAIVHFAAEGTLLPSHAGGVLGMTIGKSLQSVFNPLGATLVLLILFFVGMTLLTGVSWLNVMDVLGYHTLRLLPIAKEKIATYAMPKLHYVLAKIWDYTKTASHKSASLTKEGSRKAWDSWQNYREDWQARRDHYDDEYYDDEEAHYDDEVIEKKQPAKKFTPSTVKTGTQKTAPRAAYHAVTAVNDELIEEELDPSTQSAYTIDYSVFDSTAAAYVADDEEALSLWITQACQQLKVDITVQAVNTGPVLTGFEILSNTELDTAHLDELAKALQQVLDVPYVRVIESMPNVFMIDVTNTTRQATYLQHLLKNSAYQNNPASLIIALGADVNANPVLVDLTRVPHMLIAGSDNAEKQMVLQSIIVSLICKSSPDYIRFALIDSHNQGFSTYDHLPHLLTPIIEDIDAVPALLQWCLEEMERRYRLMAQMKVRNIENYNHAVSNRTNDIDQEIEAFDATPLPYLVIMVQEMADLLVPECGKQIEELLILLVQKARAAGIHIILATQYPSINVVTGLLKTHIPTRIALQVNTKSESRTILGQMGAETLLGQGDMLYMTAGTGMPVRVHGSETSETEVKRLVHYLDKTYPSHFTYPMSEV